MPAVVRHGDYHQLADLSRYRQFKYVTGLADGANFRASLRCKVDGKFRFAGRAGPGMRSQPDGQVIGIGRDYPYMKDFELT
jgi:hypothetical protein